MVAHVGQGGWGQCGWRISTRSRHDSHLMRRTYRRGVKGA